MLSSYRLYYVQYKEVKILWRPGVDMRAGDGGGITQTPYLNNHFSINFNQ